MLTARPQSKFTDKNGFVDLVALFNSPDARDYPEVEEWDRQYANECDQIAAKKAARYKRHWGRWYLDGHFLCTPICYAPVPGYSGGCCGVYDFSLDRCRTEQARQMWLKHLAEKDWMGEQGLAELKQAFDDLIKSVTANTSPPGRFSGE